MEKKRPLIYVYDLPPEFNSLLLEVGMLTTTHFYLLHLWGQQFYGLLFSAMKGRHFKLECVNRIYDSRNATIWTDLLYGAQVLLRAYATLLKKM